MVSVKEIYKRERITAEEVDGINESEKRRAVILGVGVDSRIWKEQEYKSIVLEVEFNGEQRKLHLNQENALEIAKNLGDNTEKWLNYILMLSVVKEPNKDIKKIKVFVWGKA